MTDPTQAVPNGDGWIPLAITLAIQALVSMALLTLPSMAPRVAEALAISPAYLGLYIALAYAGAMTASLASGPAVARFGAIRISQAGMVMCAAGLALCAVPSFIAMALGAVLIGMGYGPITPASSHLLARTTPAHRISLVFSIKQTGVPVGGALAGAIVPSLQHFAGWQQALLAVAVANIVCAFVAQRLRKDFDADRDASRRAAASQILQPVKMVLVDPALRMLAGCSFVFSIVQLSLTTYLVTYLTDSLAYGLVAAGALMSVSQAGAVLGRIGFGYFSDRWLGARRMLALLSGVMALSAMTTALLPAHAPSVLVMAVLFVFGATALGWNGVYLSEVARQAPPGMAGIATGGTLAITFFGVMLGPPLFGGLAALFGSYRVGFGALALPLGVCVYVLLRKQRDASSPP